MRYLKYVILAVLVIGLPLLYRSGAGVGEPFFCKYLCPVGTLEAGLPLVLLNASLRQALGWLFRWKVLILILCLVSCTVIYRPFCKYICPLGAFYALFQKVSLIRMQVDADACTHCGACSRACEMQVDPVKDINSAECIRCGRCVEACREGALSFSNIRSRDADPVRKGDMSV